MKADRLINCAELVKPIRALTENFQPVVDFGK